MICFGDIGCQMLDSDIIEWPLTFSLLDATII